MIKRAAFAAVQGKILSLGLPSCPETASDCPAICQVQGNGIRRCTGYRLCFSGSFAVPYADVAVGSARHRRIGRIFLGLGKLAGQDEKNFCGRSGLASLTSAA